MVFSPKYDMSNAPKTGFFQTVPGLITATAGFLSAATGAIVALNQTGVIDLKKMSANQPPAQVSPVASLSAPTATTGTGSPGSQGGTAAPATIVAEKKPVEPSPAKTTGESAPSNQNPPAAPTSTQPTDTRTASAPSTASTGPVKPSEPPAAPLAEAKPQSPPIGQPSASPTEAEKLKAIQEGAAASSARKAESPPSPSVGPVQREPAQPNSPAKVADSTTPSIRPAPSSTREEKPAAPPVTKPVEAAPIVKAPPPPPEKKSGPEPPAQPSRVVDSKLPERGPVDDPARAKVVRPPSDAVASRTGSKKQVDGIEPGGGRPSPAPIRETGSAGGSRQLDLAGIKMTIPPGWVKDEVAPGPMAPVAALRIPDPGGDGIVQITRHLGAHGKDTEERTIDRWLGQVTKANGTPSAMSDAKIERRQVGAIRITTVDLAGTIKANPRDSGTPGGRMVAAIVDHPAGPHLITIVGPSRSMAKWDAAIDVFLRSITPE